MLTPGPTEGTGQCWIPAPELSQVHGSGKSTMAWGQQSHTFLRRSQSSTLSFSGRLCLSRPESGPRFSEQNKTILFSRKMGGLGWRMLLQAW